jgi:thiol-disulfide isomerase/thioredoxin
MIRKLVLGLTVVAVSLGIWVTIRAQNMGGMITCDATTILLLYIAEHDYGFASADLDVSTFEKGQYAPLFDAMMAMGDDMTAPDAAPEMGMAEAMPEGGAVNTLATAAIPGEPAECAALRAELEAFFAGVFGLAVDTSAGMPLVDTASLPAWQNMPLVNAITGETFTLASYNGKTVYVEPFATWCTNCRAQLRTVNTVIPQVSEDVVFVAISVETQLNAQDLQNYAASNGFNMVFAVATPELLAEWVNAFGRTVLNPPATPHFIVYPDGTFSALQTGTKSSGDLLAFLGL